MPLQAETFSYLDEGTLYLTEEQRRSDLLIVDVSITSYSAPLSESYRRNPPQSIYGYCTGVARECVVFEKEVRFDYERVVEDFNTPAWLSRLLCRYFTTVQLNLRELATAIQPSLPYLQTAIAGIDPVPIRQLDSLRFKSRNPAQFEFTVYWSDDVTPTPCNPQRPDLPEAPAPSTVPRGPQPGSSSPAAVPPLNGGAPIGPLTPKPPNAFPGDFGERNQSAQPNLRIRAQLNQVVNGATCGTNISFVDQRVVVNPTPGTVPPLSAFTHGRRNTVGSSCGQWFGTIGFFYQGNPIGSAAGPIGWAQSAGVVLSVEATSDPVS